MLQEAKDLQNSAVTKLVNVLSDSKKEFTFKAPTGSGKTYMMSDFMNRILAVNENIIFIVSTLSKSNLAEQNYISFKELSDNNTFPNLKPFLINSDSSGEGSLYIPTDCNVYVLPRDLYKDTAKLKKEGTFLNFLQTMTDALFDDSKGKIIYLIKDECHIATKNLDDVSGYFSKIINFSATPKLNRKQNPDVEITNLDAESVSLIKKIKTGNEEDTLDDALCKFHEIQGDYINRLAVNPCLIIQISTKEKAEEELKNTIFPSLAKYQDLKWVYITGEDKSCDTNDAGFKKLPVSKWKNYMKLKTSSISVIIFKMVISEGWDIPRACMLYQIRDSKSKQLDEQVMGRVRRNPRLLDFETLDDTAKKLAMTAWIWGIIPETIEGIKPVKLFKNYGIEKSIRIKPTRLQDISALKNFDVNSYIDNLKDKKLGCSSIFELYRNLQKQNNEIQNLCYEYSENFSNWRMFTENLSKIKSTYDAYICDYEKSMVVCNDVSFPCESCYVNNERNITLDDWVWCRCDSENDFSFDSEAERKWAELLKEIRVSSISQSNEDGLGLESGKFLWGKNYPFNSEIKYEYYLNGVHSSYPDFVMKDKNGQIHIFEVKSRNRSSSVNIDEEEYTQKVNALKACYKECSKKTGHIFYLPLMVGPDWQITRFIDGEEENLSESQFISSVKENVEYNNSQGYGTHIAAQSLTKK